MISANGAGLIAQILPVLLLIMVVERRALGPVTIPPKGKPGRLKSGAAVLGTFLLLGFSFFVEWACVASVSDNEPISGLFAFAVTIVMLGFGVAVTTTAINLYGFSILGADKYREFQLDEGRKREARARAVRVKRLSKQPDHKRLNDLPE